MLENKRLLNQQKLYVFAEVFKKNSISKAAEALKMTQPAVSTIIKQISTHYQVKLFDVINKQLSATPAARLLFQEWQKLEVALTNLDQEMQNFLGGTSGDLKIAMVSSAKYFIAEIIQNFLEKHPGIKFHCDIKRLEQISQLVEDNAVDIGIITDPERNTRLAQHKITDNSLIFIAHPKHHLSNKIPLSFGDIAGEAFITREQHAAITQSLLQLFDQHHTNLNILFEIDSTEAVKQSVIAGIGIALVPKLAVINELQAGLVRELHVENVDLHNEWFIMTSKRLERLQIIQQFIEAVVKAPL